MKNRFKIILLILITIILDQVVKAIISIQKMVDFSIIKGFLRITYLENKGGAYGLGAESSLVLIGVNLLIVILVLKYLIKNYKTLENKLRIGLALILSGGISNLIDRLFRGYVIDYININELIKYPVFNIADICIVIGVVIMIISIIISTVKEQENSKK